MLRPLIFAHLLVLAACGKPADEGTTITLDGDNGSAKATLDGQSGAVKIDLPGFKGELKLPKIQLDADNFDLNGVHLYPGSTIETVNVGGREGKTGGLRVAFSSPAAVPVVRDWFRGKLQAAGFAIRTEGNALVGEDEDRKPFRMDLTPNGDKAARGTIAVGT